MIEDNEQNIYLATFLLEKHGFRVIQARTGPEGIEIALRTPPSLILLDIQLPGMDGFEILAALRSRATMNQLPIIAVTSHAMVGDRERIIQAGCNGYIEKPINPDTFLAEVRQHLL